jgi:hypothetical protein
MMEERERWTCMIHCLKYLGEKNEVREINYRGRSIYYVDC